MTSLLRQHNPAIDALVDTCLLVSEGLSWICVLHESQQATAGTGEERIDCSPDLTS
jgi:hypothetical protein